MDENSILDESLMKSQSEAAISKITSENDKLTELKKSYSLIVEDESLKGEAATTFRQQMADYKIIIDSAIEANRCDIEDHNSLINLLGSYYYDGYTILANKQKASDEKESDIKERDRCHDAWLNSKPWQILSSDYYFYRYLWYCHEVEMDEAEYQKWLKKEEEYDEKESSSMSLFESGDDIREIFYSALDVIPLNFKNGNYVESPNLVWKEKLADAIRKGWYDESNGTRKYNLDKLA
ncbi:MAG: hypothetical protein J6Y09_08130, partial [Lachnospiraceae bacterium]|nr:hypothetical protein [Lachnospiraceae bacterium]